MTNLSDRELLVLANMILTLSKAKNLTLSFIYKNHRGVSARRAVRPFGFWYGKSDYHADTGLFLKAYDWEKSDTRDFAVRDIDLTTATVEER